MYDLDVMIFGGGGEWDWLDQCQAVNTYMYMYKKFDRQKTDK